MRANWRRFRPEVALDSAMVSAILREALPEAEVTGFTPLAGGLANTNIDVALARPPGRVVVRIYQRDPAQARKEVALSGFLQGRVVVPAVLHFTPENGATGHPCAVMQWCPGVRLEVLQPGTALGAAVGTALAAIHAVDFPEYGFFGADLSVPEPADHGRAGMLAYMRRQVIEGPGAARLGGDLAARLYALVERDGHLLETWLARPCLVHGDFNGSNILVNGNLVSAVVDWEFAFSGSPASDFGNLLRAPMERAEFSEAVAGAYVAAGGFLPPEWRRVARLADLYAWADFLGRPAPGEALLADARDAVTAILG